MSHECPVCKHEVNFSWDSPLVSNGGFIYHKPCFDLKEEARMYKKKWEACVERLKNRFKGI